MKARIFAITAVMAASLTLAACGDDEPDETAPEETPAVDVDAPAMDAPAPAMDAPAPAMDAAPADPPPADPAPAGP